MIKSYKPYWRSDINICQIWLKSAIVSQTPLKPAIIGVLKTRSQFSGKRRALISESCECASVPMRFNEQFLKPSLKPLYFRKKGRQGAVLASKASLSKACFAMSFPSKRSQLADFACLPLFYGCSYCCLPILSPTPISSTRLASANYKQSSALLTGRSCGTLLTNRLQRHSKALYTKDISTRSLPSGEIFNQAARINFDLPELLEIQRASFNRFVKHGIPNLLSQLAPIQVQRDNIVVELVINGANFQLIAPEDTPRDCILKMKTYSCKLYVEAKIVYTTLALAKHAKTSHNNLYSTKSEWVLIGHLPIMTKRGHFIINGSPRVIVHQVVRSPGIYFQQVLEKDENKRIRFYGDIIPRRGVWLRLQITKKGKIEAKLKKGKKLSASMLQRCFQLIERYQSELTKQGQSTNYDFYMPQLLSSETPTFSTLSKLGANLGLGEIAPIPQKQLSAPLLNEKIQTTRSLISPTHSKESRERLESGTTSSVAYGSLLPHKLPIIKGIENAEITHFTSPSEEKALLYTYDKLYRPVEDKEREERSRKVKHRSLPNSNLVDKRFKLKRGYKNLFFTFKDKGRYDLSDLGREKLNTKFGVSVSLKQLTALDIYAVSNWLFKLSKGEKSVDDIDHFQNRRIRTSGELLQIQFENGIDRLKKLAWNKLKELSSLQSTHKTVANSRSQFGLLPQQGGRRPFFNGKTLAKQALLHVASSALLGRGLNFKHTKIESNRTALSAIPKLYPTPSVLRKPRKSSAYTALKSSNSVNPLHSSPLSILQSEFISTPLKELFSTKPLNGALRELFGSNPLSQYMDQTNPLAEITHKRRMSSLGVGGVSRESAGMAIRGIHPTHYGRICPIETPEGKNAGLVNSLAFYAKINDRGFIETPYYKVVKGQVQQELGFTFFSARRESASHLNIAPSDLQQSQNNVLTTDQVPVRVADNLLDLFKKIDSSKVNCIGISPVQMISVATSLIPFLEHNDANRALMGSNMQRQAVPLMIPERAIVGTGFESLVVAESGHLLQSQLTGFISYVSADRIVVDNLGCIPQKDISLQTAKQTLFRRSKASKIQAKSNVGSPHAKTILANSDPSKRSQLDDLACLPPKPYDKTFTITGLARHKARLKSPKGLSELESFSSPRAISIRSQNYKYIKQKLVKHTFQFERKQPGKQLNTILGISVWPSPVSSRKSRPYISAKSNVSNTHFSRFKGFSKASKMQAKSNVGSLLHAKPTIARYAGLPPSGALARSISSWLGLLADYAYLPKQAEPASASANSLSEKLNAIGDVRADLESTWLKDTITVSKIIKNLAPSQHFINNFDRSNQDTCLTQRARVKEGDWVQRGDILTDCSASEGGELAVGKNILVAYLPWEGYNFEDAIVISERLVKEHVYTSLHIERYDLSAQDVKEGSEWFTKDLPGISSQNVTHLDEFGLPKIGTFVKEGDILVGKMRYSNKKPTTPYERLLCDILGENNFSARDSSLYVPKGVHARVIKRQIISFFEDTSRLRSKTGKSPKLVHIFLGEKRAIQVGDKMSGRHGNKGVVATILPRQDMPYLADGTSIDIILNPLGVPSRMNVGQVFEALLGLAGTYLAQHFKMMAFDELYGVEASQSVVYLKLYQARLQSGQNWLFQVDFPGKTRLIDGRSGECFDQWITVGRAYMLKLIHMVNEKIHARATGPYALITQQPLRGRSQKGGQRLGEMEVWALEGFGAAYTLQELLTKKSDDIVGRKEVASNILPRPISIKDMMNPLNRMQENRLVLGQPEIFKVLICELQALCLDVGVYSLSTQSFQRSFLSRVN